MAAKIINKISVKTVCGGVKRKALPDNAGVLPLMRVVGQATGKKLANTDFGVSTGFIGTFEAVNVETGEVFRSGKAFFPPVVQNMIDGAMGAENNPAAFAFDIGARESDNAIGYEYTVSSLLEPSDNDPISLLKKQMGTVPALPTPKGAAQQQLAAPASNGANSAPVDNTKEKTAETGDKKNAGKK